MMRAGTSIDFGSWGQRSRSNFTLYLWNLVGLIQATVFANFTCKLFIMNRGTLYWFWVMGSKVKVKLSSLSLKPFGHNTDYNFCSIAFKLHVCCLYWEEPYWFWVTGSKVKVNLGLCIKTCGHTTDYHYSIITFKLHI